MSTGGLCFFELIVFLLLFLIPCYSLTLPAFVFLLFSAMTNTLLIGAHGKVSLHLIPLLLSNSAQQLIAIVRASTQFADLISAAGAPYEARLHPKVHSLEDITSPAAASELLSSYNAETVIFSAGAGGKGGPSKTFAIDQDACIHFIEAAKVRKEVKRFIVVSYIGSRSKRAPWWTDEDWNFTQESNNGVMKNYHKAKLAADQVLLRANEERGQGWGWSLRPGLLTDDEGGGVRMGKIGVSGSISRKVVAKVVREIAEKQGGKGGYVDFLGGDEDIELAVQRVIREGIDCAEGED